LPGNFAGDIEYAIISKMKFNKAQVSCKRAAYGNHQKQMRLSDSFGTTLARRIGTSLNSGSTRHGRRH